MAHRWERYAGSRLAGGAEHLPLAIGLTCEAETTEAEEIAEVGGGECVAGHQGFTVKIRGCRAVARCSLSHVWGCMSSRFPNWYTTGDGTSMMRVATLAVHGFQSSQRERRTVRRAVR